MFQEIDFTGRENVVKSATLELVPIGKTRDTIRRAHIIEQNKEWDRLRKVAIKAYDALTKKAIDQVLASLSMDWSHVYDLYKNAGSSKTEKATGEEAEEIEGNYRKFVENEQKNLKKLFLSAASEISGYPLNSTNLAKKFLPAFIMEEESYPLDERKEIHDALLELQNCTAIFLKIAAAREASFTMAAQRVFENFERFVDNIPKFLMFADSEDSEEFRSAFPQFMDYTMPDGYVLCLRQCDIDSYNRCISGVFNEDGSIATVGYNALTNGLNIQHKGDKSYDGPRYRKAAFLWKQVLFPSESSFSVPFVDSDEQARVVLKETLSLVTEQSLAKLTSHVRTGDKDGMYIAWNYLHSLSFFVYGKHDVIPDAIRNHYLSVLEQMQCEAATKSEKGRLEKKINSINKDLAKKPFSVSDIETILEDETIWKVFSRRLLELRDIIISLADEFDTHRIFDDTVPFRTNRERVSAVNCYFSACTDLYNAIKVVRSGNRCEQADMAFYYLLSDLEQPLRSADKALNLIRNYVTKKPGQLAHTMELFLRNNSTWTKGDGTDNVSNEISILKKDGIYYFATRTRWAKNEKPAKSRFSYTPADFSEESYELFCQSKGQAAGMFLPAAVFKNADVMAFFDENPTGDYVMEKGVSDPVVIPRRAYDAYNAKLHTASYDKNAYTEEEHLRAMYEIIEIFNTWINSSLLYRKYDIVTKPAAEFESFVSFIQYVEEQKILTQWQSVSAKGVDEAVSDGRLLLFKITNREMYRTDQKNKHTWAKQFLALFSDENLKSHYLLLNGSPHIFWRDAIIPRKVTHPKGSILVNCKDRNGERIPEKYREEIYRSLNGKMDGEHISPEAKEWMKTATYYHAKWDIVKDERFTREMFTFTFSYTINRDVPKTSSNPINEEVMGHVNKGCNVLTVIRGFDHLLYVCVRDTEGNIIHKEFLDVFDGENYQQRLLRTTFERRNEQAEWGSDVVIKNIRTGYVYKAVSTVLRLARKYDAVILIEKLNDTFKDKSAAFDNQVFKTFETLLRNKMLAYVETNTEEMEGTALHPLQLINQKIKSGAFQNGILFSLNPSFTSSLCPFTGFVNVFETENLNSIAQKRNFLSKFHSISFDDRLDGFVFRFDYKDFPVKHLLDKTEWTIYATNPATEWDRENKKYVFLPCISDPVVRFFEEEQFDYLNGNLVELIDNGCPGKYVDALFTLFMRTMNFSIVKRCEAVLESYYVSPAMESIRERYSKEEIVEMNLYKKFLFHLEHRNDFGNKYIDMWLNSAI